MTVNKYWPNPLPVHDTTQSLNAKLLFPW